MDFIMLIISLFTNLFMVGIFAFVYAGKTRYNDGMILGVHIPEAEVDHEEVGRLAKRYKQSFLTYNIWNLIAGVLMSILSLFNLTVFLAIWMVWLVGYILAGMGLVYQYHRKMYIIKRDNHWIVQRNVHGELVADDDEFWEKGWYSNPQDKRLFVSDRMCSTNYSMNMAKPAAKVIYSITAVFLAIVLVGVVVLIGNLDNAKINFEMTDNRVTVEASLYKTHFNIEDIREFKIIDQLPKDDYTRTNGGATEKYLIGHFSGRETGKCMLFLYRKHTPILEIDLADKEVYVNSKKEGEVQNWYKLLQAASVK